MATQLADAGTEIPGEEMPNTPGGDGQPLERDYEAEARAIGWKPKEEWDGRGEWRDAEAFLAFREDNLGLKKKEVDHLKGRISQLERTIRRLSKAEQRAYDSARADIEAEMEAAVESGDITAFRAAKKRADTLSEEVAAETGTTHGEDPSEQFDSFRDANPWYDKANLASASEIEVNARLYADRLADKYAEQGLQKSMAPSEFFAKIAEEVEAKYPQLKARTAREKPASDVAGVTRPGAGSKAKTGANLPPEAKAQATRFFTQGVIKGKTLAEALDTYAKSYDWS